MNVNQTRHSALYASEYLVALVRGATTSFEPFEIAVEVFV